MVSIHVPTRGTTAVLKQLEIFGRSFNPRSHEGNDLFCPVIFPRIRMFQSTFPRGERRRRKLILLIKHRVSIHVPTRGTTKSERFGAVFRRVSIHVPTRGTTLLYEGFTNEHAVSIHVPTRGTTLWGEDLPRLWMFQSTFPRGERQNGICDTQ